MAIPSVGGETTTLLGTQNADAVTITGGTINGATIGATTPAAGTFSALTAPVTLKSTRVGTFVANGATPVTVANATFAITDAVIISLNTVGGTVGVQPHVATVTGATGFTVVCTASDTSTYNYALIATA